MPLIFDADTIDKRADDTLLMLLPRAIYDEQLCD